MFDAAWLAQNVYLFCFPLVCTFPPISNPRARICVKLRDCCYFDMQSSAAKCVENMLKLFNLCLGAVYEILNSWK